MVKALVQSAYPEADVEIVPIRTSGDRGDRNVLGAFVREIQEQLLEDKIDVALHCLKDLPTKPVDGLTFAAHLPREDSSESIITRGGQWHDLPSGSVIGTGSVRRTSQIANIRTDVSFKPLVGNVDTRLRKLGEGEYDAIVLATAGLKRLGLLDTWADSEYRDLRVESLDIVAAPGQAVLVLEVRAGSFAEPLIAKFNDEPTKQASIAERSFLRTFGTGCSVPVAAEATIQGDVLHLVGLVASLDGKEILRGVEIGTPGEAASIGSSLASKLCERGALRLIPGGTAS